MKTLKSKKSKLIVIQEIEKLYNIKLKKENERNFLVHGGIISDNFYVQNNLNEVIALSITGIDFTEYNGHPSPICELNQLIYLNLTNTNLEDLNQIYPKPHLKHLFIGGNKIKDISRLKESPLLEELAIWNNPIERKNVISYLKNLKEIYCQNIGLSDLVIFSKLKKLKTLYANENKIKNINTVIKLKNLNEISLTHNEIKIIPIEIAKNINWRIFDNENSNFPESHINGIQIGNNPLEYPPISVINLGPEIIKNYFETSEKFGHAPLSEGRIIVVGDGSAGKSSLIERIMYNTFEQGKSQTNGIFIENWKLKHTDGRDLTFHIWDFGGQEIQHAVHKFFFTEGCLYVLVLDNRKEEEPEYWLQQIESLGGKAPVIIVFNKQDDNAIEISDRKFLKEKYPNIVAFHNTSCKTGVGIDNFKKELENQSIKLRTIEEQFPNNWFNIKMEIENCTSGEQHYLDFESFRRICEKHNANNENTQKLLLKYFTTIGAVTWFGDTYLNFLHVLSPKWITQGVYKIITSKRTSKLFGIINIRDFKELLEPLSTSDYTYDENHYGYILSMMKKFDLCYTPDDKSLLIPSAFGKVPKVEYSDFRGEGVRTYILQFKDYMPLALIHRFTAKKLPNAFDNNYWYSGIVIRDSKSESLAMVQADKEAKRIYVRIKGGEKLGMWEHIRRELFDIISSYAKMSYNELISLDEKSENTVSYQDLLSHIKAKKQIYFHPKLQKDFNVGYLIGMFESKEHTIEKFKDENIEFSENFVTKKNEAPPFVINILNNNSPTVNTQINNEINIDIDINFVNKISSTLKGEVDYLLEELGESNKTLRAALEKLTQFANDSKSARNSGSVIEKGWGRKLKSVINTLGSAGEQLKNIQDGGSALKSIMQNLYNLAEQFNLSDIKKLLESYLS